MKKIFFFNSIIVIFIIIFIEIIIRSFGIVSLQGVDKKAIYLDAGTILHKPNLVFKAFGKKIKTDEFGFRIPFEKFEYDKKLKTILFLGDSVTFGVGVDEKNSFVGKLRNNISKNLKNTAVAGYHIQDYSVLLKRYHLLFPDIDEVIVILCLNDILLEAGIVRKGNLGNINHHDSEQKFMKFLRNKLFIELNFFLRDKLALFNLIKAISTKNVKRHFNYIVPYYSSKKHLDDFQKNLKDIIQYSKQNNLRLNFVLLPYHHQIKKKCKDELMEPQNILKNIFNKLDYQLFDFSTEFCNIPNNDKLFLNFDPAHLSSQGHEFVSNLLMDKKIVLK